MKLLLALSVSMVLFGCVDTRIDLVQAQKDSQPVQSVPNHNYEGLELDPALSELDSLAEKYGKDFYKASTICNERYISMLDKNLDSSSDEGSQVTSEYYSNMKYCIQEQLNDFIIPDDRNEIDWSQPVDYTEGMDKSSKRYKELYATCKENNTVPGLSLEEVQSSIDLCIYRAY